MQQGWERYVISGALAVALIGASAAARAEKSNQIRPTPSPLTTTEIKPGVLWITPRLVLARYSDSLALDGLPGITQDYTINSLGGGAQVQLGVTDWMSLEVGLEGYQKLGTITGPSPGDSSLKTEADVTGNAFKFALQGHVRVFTLAEPGDSEANLGIPGDFALYLFFRGIGDVFSQIQADPLYETTFDELSFEYRAGAAAQVHLGAGVFLVGFGGIDGVIFSGERVDTVKGAESVTTTLSGGDSPFPFFGGDLLWSPGLDSKSIHNALSLGAVLALTPEDPLSGFGGPILTLDLSYTLRFQLGG